MLTVMILMNAKSHGSRRRNVEVRDLCETGEKKNFKNAQKYWPVKWTSRPVCQRRCIQIYILLLACYHLLLYCCSAIIPIAFVI